MRSRIRQGLAEQIEALLEGQLPPIRPLRAEVQSLSTQAEWLNKQLDKLKTTCEELEARFEQQRGFHPKMTVHEAWDRHPGVRAVFTRYHLPHCDRCPVGRDERLEEAAFGYSIDLSKLLEELNALS